MLIGRIEKVPFRFKIGYAVLYRTYVRSLTIVYGGLLGAMNRTSSDIMVSELLRTLSAMEADIVYLNSLEADSDFAKSTLAVPPLLSRDPSPTKGVHWRRSLPRSAEEFLAQVNKKHRYWIRRLSRILEQDFPGEVKIKYFRYSEDVEQLCIEAEKIAVKTYHRALGVGFINNDENRRRITQAARDDSMRGYVLAIGDTPVSYWIGRLFRNIFYLETTGYDPTFKKYEPGTVLFMSMVDDLCKSGIKTLDFGFGDALYKQRFGDTKLEEVSVYIFAQTFKGMMAKFIHVLSRTASQLAQYMLRRIGFFQGIKTVWRRWLSSKQTDSLSSK